MNTYPVFPALALWNPQDRVPRCCHDDGDFVDVGPAVAAAAAASVNPDELSLEANVIDIRSIGICHNLF